MADARTCESQSPSERKGERRKERIEGPIRMIDDQNGHLSRHFHCQEQSRHTPRINSGRFPIFIHALNEIYARDSILEITTYDQNLKIKH